MIECMNLKWNSKYKYALVLSDGAKSSDMVFE